MIWDYPIETTLFGYDDSNDEFLSNTYAVDSETGPLLHATISGTDSSELRLGWSVDGINFTTHTADVLTTTGTLDLTGIRAPYWRFGFRNTEGTPTSTPLCTVKWGVLKPTGNGNIRNLHDRPAEIHAVIEDIDLASQSYPVVNIYGNYKSLSYQWYAGIYS